MIYWNSGTGTVSVFLKLSLLFSRAWQSIWRCFPNPKRVTADWSVGCCCSPSKSLLYLRIFSKTNHLKKVGALFISHSLSHTHPLSHFLLFFPSSPSSLFLYMPAASRLSLMDVVKPVDHVEEGEDSGEDHPGPLVNRVHVRQVWDVHLELGSPSP